MGDGSGTAAGVITSTLCTKYDLFLRTWSNPHNFCPARCWIPYDSKALLYVRYMYGLILGGWQQLRLERHFWFNEA